MTIPGFDQLTMNLALTPHTRRQALGKLTRAALALPLALPSARPVTAGRRCRKRKRIGQKCRRRDGSTCRCRGKARCQRRRCRCTGRRVNSGGVCARRPICLPALEPCEVNADCCSRSCVQDLVRVCVRSLEGERCLSTADCSNPPFAEPLRCRGFRCVPA